MQAQRNAADGCETSPQLFLSHDQRDGLLHMCDLDIKDVLDPADTDEETRQMVERILTRLPTAAALTDDLTLPNVDGRYEVRNVPRHALVPFLEHQLHALLEGWDIDFARGLATWHACVSLLATLGHTVDGSIYARVACGCASCEEVS